MPTTRTTIELEALCAEAERRVRLGESRADVARALGVAAPTLSQWALRGRWRKKDLEGERGGELQARADEMIARLRGEEAASLAEAKRAREEAARAVAAAVAGRAAAEADARAAREALREAHEEVEAAREALRVAASTREDAGGPLPPSLFELRRTGRPGEGGDTTAEVASEEDEDVAPVALAVRSMAKAQRLMGEDRLEEAERAARVAWRVLGAVERMDRREERLQAQFDERVAAAAGATKSVVTPGFYPDRDPNNFDEKIELCWQVVRRVAFLERRAPWDVEVQGTRGFGFCWPGADAPWFMQDCKAGKQAIQEGKPVLSFAEAWPGEERELTLAEKGELGLLKGMLARWRTEVDPYCREQAIEAHRQNGALAMAKRAWPELWKGLVAAPAPGEAGGGAG